MAGKVPWWRKVIDFALGGIRSGFGLFAKNGKAHETAQIVTEPSIPETAPAAWQVAEPMVSAATPVLRHVAEPEPITPEVAEPEQAAQYRSEPEQEPEPEPEKYPEPELEKDPESGPVASEVRIVVEHVDEPIEKSPHEVAELESVEADQEAPEPVPVATEVTEPQPSGQHIDEPEPEPEPVAVEEPIVVEPESTAVEIVHAEAAAPHETEFEVTPLEFVAAEVENQEVESPLTESSPQPEKTSAEDTAADAVSPRPEPAVDAQASEQPVHVSADSIESDASSNLASEPSTELEPAGAAHNEMTAVQPAAQPEPPAPAAEPVQQLLPLPELTQEQKTAEKVAAMLKARGQDADQSPFSVIVSKIYDGPLDLLLDLIRKQDIDIYDIPIAKITAQFLAYVDRLRESDMDVAGEFIYTAALLIHIKSKMLLPRAPAGPDDAADDPRRELVERLLEHERFKNAAQMLHEKQTVEAATWTNPGMREFREDAGTEPELAADTTDLVRIFREILDRARNRPIFNVQEDTVTVGQMIQFLARRLTMEDRPVALRRLLSHTNSERALIAMFLALLEMVRLQAILLKQDRQFSEIFIKKHTGFEAAMNQGLADARDDWR